MGRSLGIGREWNENHTLFSKNTVSLHFSLLTLDPCIFADYAKAWVVVELV